MLQRKIKYNLSGLCSCLLPGFVPLFGRLLWSTCDVARGARKMALWLMGDEQQAERVQEPLTLCSLRSKLCQNCVQAIPTFVFTN